MSTTTATPATGTLEAGSLLDERKAAAILDVSLSTLRNWRWKGEGLQKTK